MRRLSVLVRDGSYRELLAERVPVHFQERAIVDFRRIASNDLPQLLSIANEHVPPPGAI